MLLEDISEFNIKINVINFLQMMVKAKNQPTNQKQKHNNNQTPKYSLFTHSCYF